MGIEYKTRYMYIHYTRTWSRPLDRIRALYHYEAPDRKCAQVVREVFMFQGVRE
jgi:hypothetical protein